MQISAAVVGSRAQLLVVTSLLLACRGQEESKAPAILIAVQTEAGVPLQGATVTLGVPQVSERRLLDVASGVTDEAGLFRHVPESAAASFHVRIEHTGRLPVRVRAIQARTEEYEFQLAPAAILAGRVTAGPRPVRDFVARVHLDIPSAPLMEPIRERTYRGTPDGRFAFDDLTEGIYAVEVLVEGHAPITRRAVCISAEHPASLELEAVPGASIQGVVLALDGSPVAGAEVTVDTGAARGTHTDEGGLFHFRDLAAGEHLLSVAARGHAPVHVRGRAGGSALTVRLAAGGAIRVYGVETGTVRLASASGWNASREASGDVHFDSVPVGKHSLVVSYGGDQLRSVPIEVRSGATTEIDLSPSASNRRGRVTFENGMPIAGAVVALSRESWGSVSTRTSEAGELVLSGIPAGRYTAAITLPAAPDSPMLLPARVGERGDLSLVLPIGGLQGTVKDAATAVALPLAKIALARLGDPEFPPRLTIAGPDGDWAFPALAPGKYELRFQRRGFADRRVVVSVPGGEVAVTLDAEAAQ